MPQVKRRKSTQVRENRTLDISGWLGYSIVNDGTVGAAVDLRRLDQNGDLPVKNLMEFLMLKAKIYQFFLMKLEMEPSY